MSSLVDDADETSARVENVRTRHGRAAPSILTSRLSLTERGMAALRSQRYYGYDHNTMHNEVNAQVLIRSFDCHCRSEHSGVTFQIFKSNRPLRQERTRKRGIRDKTRYNQSAARQLEPLSARRLSIGRREKNSLALRMDKWTVRFWLEFEVLYI